MANAAVAAQRMTIGIDLGDRRSHACVLEPVAGDVVERFVFDSTADALTKALASCPPARVVVEAGTNSPWASRRLETLGHEVVIANPREVRLISHSGRKTDRVDAETLARLGRADVRLLRPIRHRSAAHQEHLALMHARDQIVGERTALINHVRGATKSMGVRLPSCSSDAFVSSVKAEIPAGLRPALDPLLRVIRGLNAVLRRYDREIEALCARTYPHTQLLRQVKGVGPVTALAYVLAVGTPGRFRRGRSVAAYFGLCPRSDQSGESDPQMRISKAGNGFVRRLLVGSAHYILGPFGPDCALRRFGEARIKLGGRAAKKRVIVAVARRLAVLLLRLWKTAEVYEPLRGAPPVAASA